MTKSSIFKMEMYRNFRDKAYLIVIAILTGLFALAAGIGVYLFSQDQTLSTSNTLMIFEATLVIGLFLCTLAFAIVYPWHLLSTDYNNKVLSLVIASGVKRTDYYFVKIFATILTNLMAYLVIGFIPVVLLLGFFNKDFILAVQNIASSFTSSEAWLMLFDTIFSAIAMIVVLYFVVIITRGKFWGIFVYLGINFGISIFSNMITVSLAIFANSSSMPTFWVSTFFSVAEIVAFGLAGYLMIKKQDL